MTQLCLLVKDSARELVVCQGGETGALLAPHKQRWVIGHSRTGRQRIEEPLDPFIGLEPAQRVAQVGRQRTILHQDPAQFVHIAAGRLQHLRSALLVKRTSLWPKTGEHLLRIVPVHGRVVK
ncbi:hypothetical protein D3C81_2029650 [compost metagenome]